MRMVSRLQLICHQVQTPLRNPIFQFERPPPNESKMICLGELNLNLHTLQDLYVGMQKTNRMTPRSRSPCIKTITLRSDASTPRWKEMMGQGESSRASESSHPPYPPPVSLATDLPSFSRRAPTHPKKKKRKTGSRPDPFGAAETMHSIPMSKSTRWAVIAPPPRHLAEKLFSFSEEEWLLVHLRTKWILVLVNSKFPPKLEIVDVVECIYS
ncbi:hypothetical protein LINGRAHAP2_LOCUS14849 [Linum grandiflorum]